jgi:hypothetical protein
MNCATLSDLLRSGLSSEVSCEALEGDTLLFTSSSFQHADGDLIEFVISPNRGGRFTVSDAGETSERLFLSGYNINDGESDIRRFKRALAVTPEVQFTEDELRIDCTGNKVFTAMATLATTIARIESSLQPSAARTPEHFVDSVTRLLVVNRVDFEVNHAFDVGTVRPVTVQFYIPRERGSRIGYALPAKKRVPQTPLKGRLYDINRLLREPQQPLLPFIIFPDTATVSEEQAELMRRDHVRYFNVPSEEEQFLEFLRAA